MEDLRVDGLPAAGLGALLGVEEALPVVPPAAHGGGAGQAVAGEREPVALERDVLVAGVEGDGEVGAAVVLGELAGGDLVEG